MIVYHGSKVVVKPDVNQSYRPLDFGKGFYVTTVREQAIRWANRKAVVEGSTPILNVYEMSEIPANLQKRSFPDDLEEIKVYPSYDQIAFISQRAIDTLLIFKSSEEV